MLQKLTILYQVGRKTLTQSVEKPKRPLFSRFSAADDTNRRLIL